MLRHLRTLALVITSLSLSCHPPAQQAPTDAPKPTTSAITTSPTSSANAPKTARRPPPEYSQAFIALREMSTDTACAKSFDVPITPARKGAKPFSIPQGRCDDKTADIDCDTNDIAPKGADACFVSNDHIRTSERRANVVNTTPIKTTDPWDGKKKPKYFDRIDAHLHLDADEEKLLAQNGFVVLDRLAYSNYAHAFHDVFQEELPLYVGADPILNAVFRATDAALEIAERKRLVPALETMLGKLRKRLAQSKDVYDDVTLKDLDIYLGIAARLSQQWSADEIPFSVLGQETTVEALYDSLWANQGLVPIEIFGRSRMIDVSQYTPRGHYTNSDIRTNFEAYFRAMTWLTRLEWNLVSRDSRSSHPEATPDKRETPREARNALALADLFRQSKALAELSIFEDVYSAFGGKREDVGIPALLEIMDRHNIGPKDPDAPEKLIRAIGTNFKRTARTHFMPQGAKELPVISTVIGPRIGADLAPLTRLVHDGLPNRYELGAADVGYVLGQNRAEKYLQNDLKTFPDLKKNLETSRTELTEHAKNSSDLQASFLHALVTLAQNPTGSLPSFMNRDAYADMRLSSALVGYGQLRHTFILMSGQGYDAYGCAIPESYVEPLAPFYAALAEHSKRLQKVTGGGFNGLLRVLGTLSNITKTELARGIPTKDQSQWLGMVAEYIPPGAYVDSGANPTWTGWYFDMYEDREQGATRATDFIADYFTLTNAGKVAYLGADGPRLGVFVVDNAGEPRAFVGPVAHGYEAKLPIAERLNDTDARLLKNKEPLFNASYIAPAKPEPALGMGLSIYQCSVDGKLEVRVLATSNKSAGPVSITLLDHHGDPLTSAMTLPVNDEIVVFPFRFPEVAYAPKKDKPFGSNEYEVPRNIGYLVEGVSVRIEDLKHSGLGNGPYDWFTSPSVFFGKGNDENLPLRNVGVIGPLVIGGTWYPVEGNSAENGGDL
jgi:Protein of unknown function (DUF3160)